ncbi:hypothetical protein SeMB42_g00809 [Synchytrium endobioticum]|uniref:Uncharacterized protein n=1 Tax=Synchytrium endobioticum TaxID=286115 RepID=A0A507DP24_9FUNG|nr:hypothetical protein SeMB42_g00809 [Synchytrium endobioticum]
MSQSRTSFILAEYQCSIVHAVHVHLNGFNQRPKGGGQMDKIGTQLVKGRKVPMYFLVPEHLSVTSGPIILKTTPTAIARCNDQ